MACRSSTIPVFPAGGSYEYFVEEFLLKNCPCIFEEALTRQWPSRRLWVDQFGQPNLHYLQQEYGNQTVPVADCTREQFSAHPKSEMKMTDYLSYWGELMKKHKEENGGDGGHRLLYLKDWHLARASSVDDVFYTTLDYFQSDWLNETWLARSDVQDDYRFVYMGPKGTWTPFHADVFRSYSWSTNVCGCKEWLLFPPGQEDYLRDRLGNLPFDVTGTDLEDKTRYPNASKVCEPIRVIQNAGETIFIPSGWYHQVKNLEDTISINHNWTNTFGILFVWRHLQNELKLVRTELEDCRAMDGWERQCQV